MPVGNNFQHALYPRSDPGERAAYLEFDPGPLPDSPTWQESMGTLGAQLAQSGVRVVWFLHGSCLSTDIFGIQRLDAGAQKRGYSRGIPGMETLLTLLREESNGLPRFPNTLTPPFPDDEGMKGLLDQAVGDAGNFPAAYVDRFKTAANRSLRGAQPIRCVRTLWTSEHHHLGRMLGACRWLIRVLAFSREQQLGPKDRILVLAHGQAGLLPALASNLLSPDSALNVEIDNVEKVFEALKGYVKQEPGPPGTRPTPQELDELGEGLASEQYLNGVILDVVTFGTPIRYGWDPATLGRVLHIVNHRPIRPDGKRWLSKLELPGVTIELPYVLGGDYVQQLAVAGTDAVPPSPAAKEANRSLWELLEPYDGFERWLECARKSVRCANDGRCALVDYKDGRSDPGKALDHVFGHAIYTRLHAMLFNTRTIAETLYGRTE